VLGQGEGLALYLGQAPPLAAIFPPIAFIHSLCELLNGLQRIPVKPKRPDALDALAVPPELRFAIRPELLVESRHQVLDVDPGFVFQRFKGLLVGVGQLVHAVEPIPEIVGQVRSVMRRQQGTRSLQPIPRTAPDLAAPVVAPTFLKHGIGVVRLRAQRVRPGTQFTGQVLVEGCQFRHEA